MNWPAEAAGPERCPPGRASAMAQKLGDLIQSSADCGAAKAARLVTDLVTGGTLTAELDLRHSPRSPSKEHKL